MIVKKLEARCMVSFVKRTPTETTEETLKNGHFVHGLDSGVPEIWLDLPNVVLAKLLFRIWRRDRRRDDHVVTHLPVDWGCDALPVAGL